MAAALPNLSELEKTHLPEAQNFATKARALAQRPLDFSVAEKAAEGDANAKRFIEASEAKRTELKKPILDAGRKLDDFWKTIEAPAVEARAIYRAIIGRYTTEQQRIAAEKRRKAEQEARAEAERQRKAEADALMAQAVAEDNSTLMDEAIAVEQAPITPVVVATPEPVKVAGMSVRMQKVGRVEQPRVLLAWLLEGNRNDLITELIEFKQGGLNAALRRGLELPGVLVKEEPITTNRMR